MPLTGCTIRRMAQEIVTTYVDDFTGEEADEIKTHSFSLNGVNYEIDLTPDSYDQLAEALTPFTKAARKTGRSKGSSKARTESDGPNAQDIRAWAKENNYEVSPRGRVPAPIREAYSAAH